jgi:hypothetical protein
LTFVEIEILLELISVHGFLFCVESGDGGGNTTVLVGNDSVMDSSLRSRQGVYELFGVSVQLGLRVTLELEECLEKVGSGYAGCGEQWERMKIEIGE